MRKSFPFFILMILVSVASRAQELNCMVSVIAPRIQTSDKRIFTTLQTSIMEFMNNTRWTGDKYKNEEKIECSIQIEITERIGSDEFKGTIQVSSRRPVFGTSYNSPLLNYKDDDLRFRYVEYQPLDYTDGQVNPNLVMVMAFYAYTIIGFDYDTYSPLGGGPYFSKAQAIVANSANSAEPGWKAFEGLRNRFWLIENINNPIYKPIRQFYYDFHRKGLDTMVKKRDESIRQISTSLEKLRKVHNDKPLSVFMKTLFDAKSEEMVNLFTGAPGDVQSTAKQTLSTIDPINTSKYQKITGG
ncbi:MAG: DUF4835 family protein [Sphingobacteriales bacterium]|jgi:hypothetical protein|nr:DUF4835 family protein [Sphingobacteriales bacterium]